MFRAQRINDSTIINIADDGAGVNWDKLKARAEDKGIILKEGQHPSELLFMDGLSSREQASEYSGRGVGMGAFRQTCRNMGGDISVNSELTKGTTFRITIPDINKNTLSHCYNFRRRSRLSPAW